MSDGYTPKNLIKYLENLLNETCHEIIKNYKLKYEIRHRATTRNKIIFNFNYLYKRQININTKNDIVVGYKNNLYQAIKKKVVGEKYLYQGVNGKYTLTVNSSDELLCYYPSGTTSQKDEPISLCFAYTSVNGGGDYISILPVELQLSIVFELEHPTLMNIISSGILSNYVYTENNSKNLIAKIDARLYRDIADLKNIFEGFDIDYFDIYSNLIKFNISELYKTTDATGAIMDETNWTSDGIGIINFESQADTNIEILDTFKNILLSIRLKVVFPIWYTQLLSFHLKYTTDIKDWLLMMRSLYYIIENDKSVGFINSLIRGALRPRSFIHIRDLLQYKVTKFGYSYRLSALYRSPLLIWYFLNLPNINYDNHTELPQDNINIIRSLYSRIPFDEFIKVYKDNVILYLLDTIPVELSHSYYEDKWKQETKEIYELLKVEKNKRGI